MDEASQPKVSAAYEMLKRWTDIAQTDSFEALGAAAVYKTSVGDLVDALPATQSTI